MGNSLASTNVPQMLERANHPCFNQQARHSQARIHLPVAPRCNMQCNYCNRKFSCVNESRPGVTCAILKPQQAIEYLRRTVERIPNLSVVGIAGPGDPFACAEETLETLRMVKKEFPHLLLCVATNGLALRPWIDEVAKIGISHMTLTVNAVDPAIGAKLYRWMSVEHHRLDGIEAASKLWEEQSQSISALAAHGVTIKINTIYVPGVNDHHVLDVARTVAGLGASIQNIMALFPTPGTPFEGLVEPEKKVITQLRNAASKYLPQMSHCSRCRADAAGLVGEETTQKQMELLQITAQETGVTGSLPESLGAGAASGLPITLTPQLRIVASVDRPYLAIASRDGVHIDQHLGEAARLRIYRPGTPEELVDLRSIASESSGASRWLSMVDTLKDCCGVLVSGAGPVPRSILTRYGIAVGIVDGTISDALRATEAGTGLAFMAKHERFECGSSCKGDAGGCS